MTFVFTIGIHKIGAKPILYMKILFSPNCVAVFLTKKRSGCCLFIRKPEKVEEIAKG